MLRGDADCGEGQRQWYAFKAGCFLLYGVIGFFWRSSSRKTAERVRDIYSIPNHFISGDPA
jgi:hypothetical protein